jgi:hypothetical protein
MKATLVFSLVVGAGVPQADNIVARTRKTEKIRYLFLDIFTPSYFIDYLFKGKTDWVY